MSGQNPLTKYLFDDLCKHQNLIKAFTEVWRNKGAAGIDGISVEDFKGNLNGEITQLATDLRTYQYQPKAVRKVEIPKPTGGSRRLGIPCVRDRVVQTAIKNLLEPIFEPGFSRNSYGFRPGRNQQQAIAAAQSIISQGKQHVVDIDLSKFFDRVHHDKLIGRMSDVIIDKRILRLIGTILRSGIMENGLVKTSDEGVPQGSPLSPLLSNIVLDELDKELEARGLSFCRYADDCNIFVGSARAAERVMEHVSVFIERRLKLTINKEKSKVALAKHVRFLGMTIIASFIAISQVSMQRAMAKVKELTPRGTSMTMEANIKRINQWYMGWSAYYRMTQYPTQLGLIEAHLRRRLRSRIVAQQKRRRHLYEKLIKRGVPKKMAGTVFSNRGRWALSHSKAVEVAYPNRWFINTMGLKVRTDKKMPHWKSRREWVKFT